MRSSFALKPRKAKPLGSSPSPSTFRSLHFYCNTTPRPEPETEAPLPPASLQGSLKMTHTRSKANQNKSAHKGQENFLHQHGSTCGFLCQAKITCRRRSSKQEANSKASSSAWVLNPKVPAQHWLCCISAPIQSSGWAALFSFQLLGSLPQQAKQGQSLIKCS